ncbi:MAG TPA: NlpC/P60 family protein [Verrucomicrobiae bacterium]|nr:NlpC/P60 family protein [Verrucomicrobiae bacterium]
MTPFFHTADQLAVLQRTARAWLGTPFRAHLAVPGVGVDCVQLCAAIYQRLGVIDSFTPPPYQVTAGPHRETSQVEAFLAAMPERFQKVGTHGSRVRSQEENGRSSVASPPQLSPGDLLCFHVGRVTHHCGVLIRRMNFIHAIHHCGVVESTLADSNWLKRLRGAYRPLCRHSDLVIRH